MEGEELTEKKRIFIYAFDFRWYNVHTDYMIEGVFWYGTDNNSGNIQEQRGLSG